MKRSDHALAPSYSFVEKTSTVRKVNNTKGKKGKSKKARNQTP